MKALSKQGAFRARGLTMVISTVIGTLFGALLGLRFRALIVAPVIFVAVAIIAVGGMARGDEAKALALAVIVVAASLQVGYVAGCTLRAVVAAARARNDDGVALPTRARLSKSV
jgi:hypothetical protein